MMKKADKKAWVKALRSGEYKRGVGYLCRNDKYCCLGVAYDVLYDGDWKQDSKQIWRPDVPGIGISPDFLQDPIEKALGIPQEVQSDLAALNDIMGFTFEHIAEWIEDCEEL